jgi:ElaB/YqjD/DUF883 family membrane-anchored ribosome-binding protein
MATLEDAAEALVVKLRGLDSEIEESEEKLQSLRDRLEAAAHDVEREWTALREAASSLLEKLRAEHEQLATQVQETSQAMVVAQNAVAEDGSEARNEMGEARAQLDALAQHATGLEPGVESLASDAGEAPAKSLAQRARELQQELDQLVEEARNFLQDEVVNAANDTADEVRQMCQTLHESLAEGAAEAFQDAYDQWESAVGELEGYVVSQGYEASREHARAVVEYAAEECATACVTQMDDLQQLVGLLATQLEQMADQVEQSAEHVVTQAGAQLLQELEATGTSAKSAVAALDAVKRQLAQYSFVEV